MSSTATGSQVRVAAFDVDGTLTTRDCVVPFLLRVGGPFGVTARMLMRPHVLLPAVVRRDRDRLKELASDAAFRNRQSDAVEHEAVTFASEIHANRMRRDTVQHLQRHIGNGDAVILVSASFELYLRPLASSLTHWGERAPDGSRARVDVLATRLAVDADGRLTGGLDGLNCRGPEKVTRLHSWLDAHHGGRGAVHLTAYGDSGGDRELLCDADDPYWVGSGSAPSWFPV